jgi:hypothetical protein
MNVPFPPFPCPLSLSIFPVKSSHWRSFLRKLLHTEVLKVFPFPLFPAHLLLYIFPTSIVSLPTFPYPRSLPEAVSGSWLTRVPSTAEFVCFPSLILPSHCSLPSFPIFDYVPALFPYFRLFPCPPFIPGDLMLLIQIVTMTIYV